MAKNTAPTARPPTETPIELANKMSPAIAANVARQPTPNIQPCTPTSGAGALTLLAIPAVPPATDWSEFAFLAGRVALSISDEAAGGSLVVERMSPPTWSPPRRLAVDTARSAQPMPSLHTPAFSAAPTPHLHS